MKYKSSAVCLHCRKLDAPASIQDRCYVMEQEHPLLAPPPRTQHPTASLRLQPSLSFSFTSPTSQIQLNSACPLLALPPPRYKRSVLKFRGQEEEM